MMAHQDVNMLCEQRGSCLWSHGIISLVSVSLRDLELRQMEIRAAYLGLVDLTLFIFFISGRGFEWERNMWRILWRSKTKAQICSKGCGGRLLDEPWKERIMAIGHFLLGIYSHCRRNNHLYIIIFATDRCGNSTCLAVEEFRLFGKHYIPGVELFFHLLRFIWIHLGFIYFATISYRDLVKTTGVGWWIPEGWFKICRWRDTHTQRHTCYAIYHLQLQYLVTCIYVMYIYIYILSCCSFT